MKTRNLFLLALILALFMAGAVPATAIAGHPVVPLKGHYLVHPQILGMENGCLVQKFPAEGQATHLGESTFVSNDARSCFDGTQYGTIEFTADNGDLLWMSYAGTHAGYPGPVIYGGTYTITGGTGRFEGASGSGAYWGSSAMDGHGTFFFDGTLIK
jgi:hypothetical protein